MTNVYENAARWALAASRLFCRSLLLLSCRAIPVVMLITLVSHLNLRGEERKAFDAALYWLE